VIDACEAEAYDAAMRKALIFMVIGLVVFGGFFWILWSITKPVFNVMPELNGPLLLLTFGLPLVVTAGVMRLVWAILYGRRGRKP
jgi:hypothetical protein